MTTDAAATDLLLDDELGVPADATVNPTTVAVRFETVGGGGGGVSLPLSSETCNRPNGRSWLVGRQGATADIRIQHKSISRKHAVVYVVDGSGVFLKDYGGKHGTAVNGRKVDPDAPAIRLRDGDTVQFGNVREQVFRVKLRPIAAGENERNDDDDDDGTADGGQNQQHEQQQQQEPREDAAMAAVDAHDLIEKAGEGLTGRERRQAEIAAMMESLDQAPTYKRQDVPVANAAASARNPPSGEESRTTFGGDAMENNDEVGKVVDRYKLPISNRFTIPSESERKNVTTCIAIDPNGARFVVGSTDMKLRFYDFGGMDRNRTESFKELVPDDGHVLVSVAFSNTGDRMLVGTGSVQPKVLDREGGEVIKFMRGDAYVIDQAKTVGHTAAVTSVDWHPFERDVVLTSSNDGSARLWNLNGKTQFQMLVCDKVFQAKSERGKRTSVKCVCFHPGGREFALGTACGSIQIWNKARVSGRPERAVFDAHGSTSEPVTSLAYSVDGLKLASRSENNDTARVWNAQRLSRSSAPLVICSGLETVHEMANAAFSPKGKILCAGSSSYRKDGDQRMQVGSLNFYDIAGLSQVSSVADPILSLDMDGKFAPVIVKWHPSLNQIFVGCSDGRMLIFYHPERSVKGALLPAAKTTRGVDGLSELLKSRAPQGSAAISGEIITPMSLPMFRDNTVSEKKRKRLDRKDPMKSKEPERPVTGKHKTGSQDGGGVRNFAQFVADQTSVKTKVIAGRDPREALFQYDEGVDEGRKLAEKTVEEEEEEQK